MLTRIISGIVMGVGVVALLFLCSWHYFAFYRDHRDHRTRRTTTYVESKRSGATRLPLGLLTAMLAWVLILKLNIVEGKVALVSAFGLSPLSWSLLVTS